MGDGGEEGFFHALYKYHPHRPQLDGQSTTGDSVASFLQQESTTDGDFSLSLVCHNLGAAVEGALRDFIARRLSRGTIYSGAGNVAALETEGHRFFCCYFCLLRGHSVCQPENQEPDLDKLAQALGGVSFVNEEEEPSGQNEYVVCFLTDFEGLELYPFRIELDSYSQELLELLSTVKLTTSLRTESKANIHLRKWADSSLFYVRRCVTCLDKDLSPVLYASLCCMPVTVESTHPECSVQDVQSFVKACGLEALMKAQQQAITSLLIDFSDSPTSPVETAPKNLHVCITPSGCELSNRTTNKFCESWASALQLVSDLENPFTLRQVVDNFKLKAIQHMNTLRRLLRHSETDHYALYRCYVFLDTCGMGDILLDSVMQEARTTSSKESEALCSILKNFIESLPR